MVSKKEELMPYLAYVSVCIFWGSTFLAIRIGISDIPPMLFGGLRFLTAGFIVLLFAYLKGLKFPDTFKDVMHLSLIGLIMMLGSNGLVVWSEQWVESGTTSLLVATSPLWIAIIQMALPERTAIGFKGWLGLIIGFAGVTLLIYSGRDAGTVDMRGGILISIAAFLWALGSVLSKRLPCSGSIVARIGIQMLAGGVGQFTTGVILGELPRLHFSAQGTGALLYLIFFGSIAGYSSYIYLLQKWPVVKAGTYAYVNPAVAVILGAVVLGEQISMSVIVSFLIILCGVFLVQFSRPPVEQIKNSKTTVQTNDI